MAVLASVAQNAGDEIVRIIWTSRCLAIRNLDLRASANWALWLFFWEGSGVHIVRHHAPHRKSKSVQLCSLGQVRKLSRC
jgi:hypothetical protein